jgi:hypothetical protein
LIVQTEALPPETGACESRTDLSYARVRLNEADFLLPFEVQLHILNSTGVELENTTIYAGCHEFHGESTLSFDAPAEPGAPASRQASVAAGELPGGLPFTIALTKSIDAATAAAGDKLAAILTTPIRDAVGRTLVPSGAAVTARIVQIRRFYVPEPMVKLVFKLETVEFAGAPRRLAAASEFWNTAPSTGKGGFERRIDLATPDNQDPEAAVFEARRPSRNIVPAFESKWSTVARKP